MTTVSDYAEAGWTLERAQQHVSGHSMRPVPRTVASYPVAASSPVAVKPGMPSRRLTAPSSDDVRLATFDSPTTATKSSSGSSKRRPVSRRRDLLDALRNLAREQTPPAADLLSTSTRRKSSAVSCTSSAASSSTVGAQDARQAQRLSDDKGATATGGREAATEPAETHRRSRSLFFNQKTLFGGGNKGEGKATSQKAVNKSVAEAAALARFNAMSAAVAASIAATHDVASEVMLAENNATAATAEYARVMKSFAPAQQPHSVRPSPEDRRKRAYTVASASPPMPVDVSPKQHNVDATVLLRPPTPSSASQKSATPSPSRTSLTVASGTSAEGLSSQLLTPSNMTSGDVKRAPIDGRRPSSAARRYAEETRMAMFRSQESLLFPQAGDEEISSFAKFHLPDSLASPERKELSRALPPPRRQTRRARAQSSIETMQDDMTIAAATAMRASASVDSATGPQKFVSTVSSSANSSPRRLQRRTSESSLASSTASMCASTRSRMPSHISARRLCHTDSIGTDVSRGSSAAELTGQQGARHSFCSSVDSNTSSLNEQHRASPLEHPYHTRTSHVSPSLASYASAQSDLWGSCYSSSSAGSSKKSSPTWQITPLRAPLPSARQLSTANTSDAGSVVPPVPSVPAHYATRGGGVSAAAHISSIVAHVSSSSSARQFHARRPQWKRCESEVNMAIANCVRNGAANTMVQYARDDCHLPLNSSPTNDDDEDEGQISLETPTFGYVASFVTAASNTPRPSDQAYFRGIKATVLPPRPNSAQSGWSNTWALGGDYDMCALADEPKRGLIPFRTSEVVPVSPKTVEFGWEKRAAAEANSVEASLSAQPMIRSFSTQGLGLSHVKMALAEHTHSLQHHSLPRTSSAALVSRFSQDSDSVATPPSSRQSSISKAKRGSSFSQQALTTLLQQRRTSLRLTSSRARGGA